MILEREMDMLHFGKLEIPTGLLVGCCMALLFAVQLFLCFRLEGRRIRWIPCILFAAVSVILVVVALFLSDWDRFGVFLLAGCSGLLLLGCGVAWGIWAIVKQISRKAKK